MKDNKVDDTSLPAGIETNAPMARLSTLRTGGPADFLAVVDGEDQLAELLAWAATEGIPVATVGSGSNLLIADEGFRGLVLRLRGTFLAIERRGSSVVCGAAARLPAVAARTAQWGLTGIEFGINIPGTVGGSIRMNANAFGGSLGAVLGWADIRTSDGLERRSAEQLEFGYRTSSIAAEEVVTRASFDLSPSDPETVSAAIQAIRGRRRETQPLGIRTLGSTFRNPDESVGGGERAAARLLADADCQELRVGDARFSPQHANFIQLDGPSSSAEVLELISRARRRVHERFGVELEPEVQVLGEAEPPGGWEL